VSVSGGRRKARADVGGRPLLAVLSIALIAAGILKADQLIGFPLVLLGVLLAILYAFHSRIMGVRISDKIQLPIAPEMPEESEEARYDLQRLPHPQNNRPSSLGEVSEAARNPGSQRRRYGGSR
jgi:hypothetical protein